MTLLPIVIVSIPALTNKSVGIDVSELPTYTVLNEVQPSNTADPIDVTESGMANDVSDPHPWNVPLPMVVNEDG